MKRFILIILFLMAIIIKSFSQNDSILLQNYGIIKESLIDHFGSKWYNSFSEKNGWFYINVKIDSTGSIVSINELKTGIAISEKELCSFSKYLEKNIELIPYSPDPHFTKEQYFEIHKNCVLFPFKFSDRIFKKEE